MARPLRIEFSGAVYHVTSRGDRQEDIYLDHEDRKMWISVFAEVCSRFNWRCHAWVQMTNHYHLLVETVDGNLSKGMRHLNGVYTQKHNRRHKRVGHVFQGRYKAILVDKESYLLEVSRYIVLNPLRARMIERLSDWRWSSYRAMIGRAVAEEWLETDWILGCFGSDRSQVIKRYVEFVSAGKGLSPVWEDKIHPSILGDETFIESVYRTYVESGTAELREINRQERCWSPKELRNYFDGDVDRVSAISKAYKQGGFTMKEIGDYCGIHYSTVSRIVNSK